MGGGGSILYVDIGIGYGAVHHSIVIQAMNILYGSKELVIMYIQWVSNTKLFFKLRMR